MKRSFFMLLAAFAIGGSALHAEAPDEDCCCSITCGYYLSGFGGISWWIDHFGVQSDAVGAVGEFEMEMGYNIGGAFGYRLCNGLRMEFEVAYRNTDYGDVKAHNAAGSGITFERIENSDWDITSYMVNIALDDQIILCGECYRPYFGFGLGAAYVEQTLSVLVDGISFGGEKDHDWCFMYQLIGGLAMPINDCWDIALEYRFVGLQELEFTVTGGGSPILFSTRNHAHSHELIVSSRYVLGSLF